MRAERETGREMDRSRGVVAACGRLEKSLPELRSKQPNVVRLLVPANARNFPHAVGAPALAGSLLGRPADVRFRDEAENICLHGVFRILTQRGPARGLPHGPAGPVSIVDWPKAAALSKK